MAEGPGGTWALLIRLGEGTCPQELASSGRDSMKLVFTDRARLPLKAFRSPAGRWVEAL